MTRRNQRIRRADQTFRHGTDRPVLLHNRGGRHQHLTTAVSTHTDTHTHTHTDTHTLLINITIVIIIIIIMPFINIMLPIYMSEF